MIRMESFDFNAPAEIFASKSRGVSRRPMTYRRFATGAEAIRYAMEVLSVEMLAGTVMEASTARFGAAEIRKLYDSPEYPLQRAKSR